MKTNQEIIREFCNNRYSKGQNGSLRISDGRLYSYNTCIGEYLDNNTILVNVTKYSKTTSMHQNLLVLYSNSRLTIDNIERNTYKLTSKLC